jgi:hypothetical protein
MRTSHLSIGFRLGVRLHRQVNPICPANLLHQCGEQLVHRDTKRLAPIVFTLWNRAKGREPEPIEPLDSVKLCDCQIVKVLRWYPFVSKQPIAEGGIDFLYPFGIALLLP